MNNINGKVYFGKTNKPDYRWYQHKQSAKSNPKFVIHFAMKKYGIENFTFEVIHVFNSDKESGDKEKELIASANKNDCYNVAIGGNGGMTLSKAQIDNQYSIPEARFDELLHHFNNYLPLKEIAKQMGVGYNSLKGAMNRMNLNVKERNKSRKTNQPQNKAKKAQYSIEERSNIWSQNITKLNKERGISSEQFEQIKVFYFEMNFSAIDIASKLKINRSTVRGVVNRAYNMMEIEERKKIKKERASIVRQGTRNSNYGSKHKI